MKTSEQIDAYNAELAAAAKNSKPETRRKTRSSEPDRD